jgi:hypothetical protein
VRGLGLGLAIAAVVSVLAPGVGQAAETSAALYDCRPRDPKAADPPPQPVLPPEVAAAMSAAIASDEFKAVCPAGEVPEPTGTKQFPKQAPPAIASAKGGTAQASRVQAGRVWGGRKHSKGIPRATVSRSQINGYWYSWSYGVQEYKASKGINGLFVQQTNELPYIPTGESELGAHSSGQLWAINNGGGGCYSTAETGWSESIGQFKDANPHLFVYAIDCGVGIGYSSNEFGGVHWVQSSSVTFPNQVLTHNDAFHVYGARMTGNNWWIYYDGQWVGYIPHSAWTYRFPSVVNEGLAGGEVMTGNYSTCADMGYAGLFGGNPGAAMFSSVWYEYNYNTQSALTDLLSQSSDPSYYATGSWSSPPNHGYAFRYGGPGWC